MASNSSSSKAWCITLVSAILVLVADKSKAEFAFIAVIPIFLFYLLDAYYLALEQSFRKIYNAFTVKLHDDKVYSTDVYTIKPEGVIANLFSNGFWSLSTWPFYVTLLGMVWIAEAVVISQ